MLRSLLRVAAFLSFSVSMLFIIAQGLLIFSDVVLGLVGQKPFLMILTGDGPSSWLNIFLTLWVYFSFTAYSAFWFCAGMGLSALTSPRTSV